MRPCAATAGFALVDVGELAVLSAGTTDRVARASVAAVGVVEVVGSTVA
ncbi:hypothetical protein [Atopobium deltae]|nr:hypothetical protein [Atopobium deltae]